MTKHLHGIDRRTVLGGLGALAAGGPALAASPPLPTSPVVISVMDVGGALALMQKAFEDYRRTRPEGGRGSGRTAPEPPKTDEPAKIPVPEVK